MLSLSMDVSIDINRCHLQPISFAHTEFASAERRFRSAEASNFAVAKRSSLVLEIPPSNLLGFQGGSVRLQINIFVQIEWLGPPSFNRIG